MFKRAMTRGILVVSLVAILSSTAKAHYQGYQTINGYLVHVSSFDCGIQIKGVSNLEQHPAMFECTAMITRLESLCENPANHDVRPGKVATRITLINQAPILAENITDKKRGRANTSVTFNDDLLSEYGLCVNSNWHVVDVLATNVRAALKTFECIGPASDPCSILTPAYVEVLDCVLPPQYNLTNPPPANTSYTCSLISKEHID